MKKRAHIEPTPQIIQVASVECSLNESIIAPVIRKDVRLVEWYEVMP